MNCVFWYAFFSGVSWFASIRNPLSNRSMVSVCRGLEQKFPQRMIATGGCCSYPFSSRNTARIAFLLSRNTSERMTIEVSACFVSADRRRSLHRNAILSSPPNQFSFELSSFRVTSADSTGTMATSLTVRTLFSKDPSNMAMECSWKRAWWNFVDSTNSTSIEPVRSSMWKQSACRRFTI